MTAQQTYPISKIRSGEVAVRLTGIEQFKKIAPENCDNGDYYKGLYHSYKYYKRFTYMSDEFALSDSCDDTLIDFTQIDWEEGKEVDWSTIKDEDLGKRLEKWEEGKEDIKPYPFYAYAIGNYRNNCTACKNTFTGDKRAVMCLECAIIAAKKELASLKAENERLVKETEDILKKNVGLVLENEGLMKDNGELMDDVIKLSKGNKELLGKLATLESSQSSQELSLRQRLAWELYVAGFNHGIADKWTIAECYRSANIFLNYKGGENEQ